MTPAPRERAAVDRAPADPAREPGLSVPVPPVADRPGTLDGAAGDTTHPTVRRAPSSQSPPGPRRAAAGTPAPDTGAVRLDRVTAPARGRSKTPAGGALASRERASAATSVPPAGSSLRTYTIALPPGLKLLSLNDRGHWAARYRRSEAIKEAAFVMALQAKVPRLERVSVVVEYQPPDRRLRDPDNVAASAKAAIDGCRAAKVLPNDDSRHVTEVTCTIGEPYPKGRLVLYLIEVPAAGDAP